MIIAIAGNGLMSAYYPPESELYRRVKQIIKAGIKHLEAACRHH